MAKRFPNFHLDSHHSKKAKLDISIGRRDSRGASTKSKPIAPAPEPIQTDSEQLFDDDDNDVILLASQYVEQQEVMSQQILIDQPSITDISFSHFANQVTTSTQLTTKIADPQRKNDPAIDQLFQDDFEFDTEPFKIPKLPKNYAPATNSHQHQPSTHHPNNDRKTNKERDTTSQVKYLTNKVASLRELNEKLTRDLTDFNDKMQTKEGEVSLVRQQLQQFQKQNESLRLAKMQEIDNVKKEWREKIAELEKLIKSQQDDLEFKNVEIVGLKSSRLNSSERNAEPIELRRDLTNVPFMLNLHLDVNRKFGTRKFQIPLEIFEKQAITSKINFQDMLFQRELDNIQACLSQLQIAKQEGYEYQQIGTQLAGSMEKVIPGLMAYTQTLEFMKYSDTNASVEYKFLCTEPEDEIRCCLHKEQQNVLNGEKSYPTEKAITQRRVFGGLSIACKFSAAVCQELLTTHSETVPLIQTLIKAIDILGFSKEIFNHYGIQEALAQLLYHWIQNNTHDSKSSLIVGQFLRSLIFCRPNHRTLVYISKCLDYIAKNSVDSLRLLCIDSPLGSFVINEYYKIFQFSSTSCTLQVYGALLETTIPQDCHLTRQQIENLVTICYNHINFLRSCFEQNISWILKTNSSTKACDCYAKTINSAVTLMHLVLKLWIEDPKAMDNKAVARIARNGILLLYDAYYKNYRRELLQNGGSTIKNRLQIIHDWFNEYKSVFHFKTAHNYALQSIKLSHIIADPIHGVDESSDTIETVTEGNQIWSEIFDNFL